MFPFWGIANLLISGEIKKKIELFHFYIVKRLEGFKKSLRLPRLGRKNTWSCMNRFIYLLLISLTAACSATPSEELADWRSCRAQETSEEYQMCKLIHVPWVSTIHGGAKRPLDQRIEMGYNQCHYRLDSACGTKPKK